MNDVWKEQKYKVIQVIDVSRSIISVIPSHNIKCNYVAQIVCLQKLNCCYPVTFLTDILFNNKK